MRTVVHLGKTRTMPIPPLCASPRQEHADAASTSKTNLTALLIASDVVIQTAWRSALEQRGWRVRIAGPAGDPGAGRGLEQFALGIFGVDDSSPDADLGAAERLRRAHPGAVLWLSPRRGSETLAVLALRTGFLDYLPASRIAFDLDAALARLAERGERRRPVTQAATGATDWATLVGPSPAMQQVRDRLASIASSDCNVLLTGETGTGKDLVAENLQLRSRRRSGPFVRINCAAIPEALFESEMFGYERGAFTGALSRHDGALLAAQGGTVFLDEIGELTQTAQAKLLRVLESHEMTRLGGRGSTPLDVRFIAASNRISEEWGGDCRIRPDLFFRLNVMRIHLSPLRERREDVLPLARHLLRVMATHAGVTPAVLSESTSNVLLCHDWPGNVRELRNVLEAAFLRTLPQTLEVEDLPSGFVARARRTPAQPASEREKLLGALDETDWNKSRAAERLHWSRMTLYRKLAKYRLTRP
jgi:DNA-binding NtrC family response regulator